MRVVFSTDLHGNSGFYRELVSLAKSEKAEALVLGGDLLPPPHGLGHPRTRETAVDLQRSFLREELLPLLSKFRNGTGAEVLLMLGNYDTRAVEAEFEEECAVLGFLTLHERVRKVRSVTFAGLCWVNPTPFPLKDWEVFDLVEGEMNPAATGVDDFRAVITAERTAVPPTMAAALENTARRVAAANAEMTDTILVLHAPPFDTGLDIIRQGKVSVGSRAVRRFIEERNPRLTLHGHIHESPMISGEWFVLLGKTPVIQPGQGEDRLHAVILETTDPLSTARHTVLGRREEHRE